MKPERKHLSAIALGVALLLVALAATGSRVQAAPIDAYVIFAQTRVMIGQGSVITGLVGANFKADDDAALYTEIYLNGTAQVLGDVQSGDDVHIGNGGVISGTITLPQSPVGLNPLNPAGAGVFSVGSGVTYGGVVNAMPALPSLPAATVFVSGGTSFNLGNNANLTLAPGPWGDVALGGNAVLNLSSGDYFFDSLKSANGLQWNLDLSGGPIRVFATNAIQFGSVDMVLTGGGASQVDIETHFAGLNAFQASGNSHVFGDVFAPYGTIHIGSGSSADASFFGHLWGYDVDIEHGVAGGSGFGEVPEPGTLLLLGTAALGLFGYLRRQRMK